jgi:FlaG/FlaF family flagellin (archaellin)
MNNLRKKVRAISPVLAILLMIVITVAASLVTYAWVMGYITFTTEKAGQAAQIQSVALVGSDLKVYVLNVGEGVVNFDEDGEDTLYLNGLTIKTTIDKPQLGEGETATFTVPNQGALTGQTVTIKVVSRRGTFSEATTTLSASALPSSAYWHYVNTTSNVDGVADKGSHSNFPAQQAGPDASYDILTEDTSLDVDNNVDAEIVTHGSTTGIGNAQTTDGATEGMTEETSGSTTPPTYHGFREGKRNYDHRDVWVSKPSGTSEGDLLIAVHVSDGQESSHTASGWSLIDKQYARSGDRQATISVWRKIAGSSEPSSYRFRSGSNEEHYAFIMRITGHDASDPIDVWWVADSENNRPRCPSVTTTKDNCLILRIFGADDDDQRLNSGYPSGHTGITSDESGSGSGTCSGGAAYRIQASAGSTNTADFSLYSSEEWAAYTIAIAPTPPENQLDVEHSVNSIGEYQNYELTTRAYCTASETFYLQMWDFTHSQWVTMDTITASSLTWYNKTFDKADFISVTNEARIRYWQDVDGIQGTLYVDYSGVHEWNPTNYEMNLEVQFTDIDVSKGYTELCIFTGSTGDEDLEVHIWNGVSWELLLTALAPNQWNNVTRSITSETVTLNFIGNTELGDLIQDSWEIDCVLLYAPP